MALRPTNDTHASQILAGTNGRNRGHKFEKTLTDMINQINIQQLESPTSPYKHVVVGNPGIELVKYIIGRLRITGIKEIKAWWVGGLATSGVGDILTDDFGNKINKCKSDVVIKFDTNSGVVSTGVSVKTCSKKSPTNAQLYFTTASSFCRFLRENDIEVSSEAEIGLKMFCGDSEYRPLDNPQLLNGRLSDPSRFFWEEIPTKNIEPLTKVFEQNQDAITRLLLQKAYNFDPYPPDFILHQTCEYNDINSCEIALYTVNELIELSRNYKGFYTKEYTVNKGTYKSDPHIHEAPRFGIVQFQRAGNKQHPTQLQFNLQAGYFRKI